MSITDLVTRSNSLSINLTPGAFGNLQAGGTSSRLATPTSGSVGPFSNQYQLNFVSSKGGQSQGGPQSMTLTVTGVIIVPEPGAIALAGIGLSRVGRPPPLSDRLSGICSGASRFLRRTQMPDATG